MNAFMMTFFAMLMSTTSARMLKGDSCSSDYQSPNYWGKCIDGEYKNVDIGPQDEPVGCKFLVILVPQDIVGIKELSIYTEINHGFIARDLFLNEYGYYAVILQQDSFKGPDVDITFYLNMIPAHHGNYQQNACVLEAGSVTTNDPNTKTYEGSWGEDMPGHVIINSFE